MVLSPDDVSFAHALARKAAWPFHSSPFYDDLVSAGLEVAIKAARDYVEPDEGGSRWNAYLSMRVRGAVIDEMRALSHHRLLTRHGIEQAVSLDRLAEDENAPFELADRSIDVEGEAMDRMEVEALLDDMSPRDAAIMRRRYLEGATQQEVGAELGVTNSRICQLEVAVRRVLSEVA